MKDLKKPSVNAATFFDMIFDIQKYEVQLRRVDPVFREFDDLVIVDGDGAKTRILGWDKFAEKAYEHLVSVDDSMRDGANTEYAADSTYSSDEWVQGNLEWSEMEMTDELNEEFNDDDSLSDDDDQLPS